VVETPGEFDRDILLGICERAFVPQESWHDRDSAFAQRQLGECYALLKAGCDFSVEVKDETIWVDIHFQGFAYFEEGGLSHDRFYLPTKERLANAKGGDWY
jgi:hypothetical protein